jgi:hypothetical protein
MTIKVNYDIETTLVKGYYHDSINYASIPEPFIEIEDDAQDNSKQMCVIDEIYQEYVTPTNVLLAEAKAAKIAQLESLRKAFQYANLEVNGHIYVNTETAQNKFFNKLANTTFPMDWRLANLSWVILDQQEALEVRDVIVARETLAYQTESDYFTEINDCTTLEELNTININFN